MPSDRRTALAAGQPLTNSPGYAVSFMIFLRIRLNFVFVPLGEEYDPRVNTTVVDEAYSRALAVQEARELDSCLTCYPKFQTFYRQGVSFRSQSFHYEGGRQAG